jgi:hypothetical protein
MMFGGIGATMQERFGFIRFRLTRPVIAAAVFLYAVAGYSQWSFMAASAAAVRPKPKIETTTTDKVAKFSSSGGTLTDSSITDSGGNVDVVGNMRLLNAANYFAVMRSDGNARAALFNSSVLSSSDPDFLDFGGLPNGFRFVNSGNVTRMTIDNVGHVGINPSGAPLAPAAALEIDSSSAMAYSQTDLDEETQIILANLNGTANNTAGLSFNGGAGAGNQSAYIESVFSRTNSSAAITFGTRNTGGTLAERVRISEAGNVGIGMTPAGTNKLDVAGAIHATGTITSDAGITAVYQDLAEWVPAGESLDPGTVVVLNRAKSNEVVASTSPYDTTVAGVVSLHPGIVLGKGAADKAQVATTGRVKVKVDATRGAIHVGDLLVTSDVAGMAMKSVPVEVGGISMHRPGTIIGKALEPLSGGVGEILVLLSLQ